MPLTDIAAICDNSDDVEAAVATKYEGEKLIVVDPIRWALIEEAGR